jgi:hypothetical protein
MKAPAALLALLVVLLLAGLLLLGKARARREGAPGRSASPSRGSAAPPRVETAPLPPVEGPAASAVPAGPEEDRVLQETL